MYVDTNVTEVLLMYDDALEPLELKMTTAVLDAAEVPYTKRGKEGRTSIVVLRVYREKLLAAVESHFRNVKHMRDMM